MASVCVEVKSLCSCCAPGRLLSVAHQIANGKSSASHKSRFGAVSVGEVMAMLADGALAGAPQPLPVRR